MLALAQGHFFFLNPCPLRYIIHTCANQYSAEYSTGIPCLFISYPLSRSLLSSTLSCEIQPWVSSNSQFYLLGEFAKVHMGLLCPSQDVFLRSKLGQPKGSLHHSLSLREYCLSHLKSSLWTTTVCYILTPLPAFFFFFFLGCLGQEGCYSISADNGNFLSTIF